MQLIMNGSLQVRTEGVDFIKVVQRRARYSVRLNTVTIIRVK